VLGNGFGNGGTGGTTGTATPTRSSGGLAFTGANIMKLGGVAALLIAFGALLVFADRRRSRLQG